MEQPDFGKKLAEIRRANGITQDELAEKCRITVRTIQRIEAGLVKPRAFTIKVISDTLGFDFFETSKSTRNDVNIVNPDSNRNKSITILWYLKDLFNLKTQTMKKITILSIIICSICIGLFTISNDSKAQNPDIIDYSKFMESNCRGIIYFFPKGKSQYISNMKDTADYRIGKDLIQEYKDKIFLNGKYITTVFKSDSIIFNNEKIIVRPSFWKLSNEKLRKLNYFFPIGTVVHNLEVNGDTVNIFFGEHQIQEYEYKIFLDGKFKGKANPEDSITFRYGLIEILK